MKIEDFCEIERCLVIKPVHNGSLKVFIAEIFVNEIAEKAIKLRSVTENVSWYSDLGLVDWELLEVLSYRDDSERKKAETT